MTTVSEITAAMESLAPVKLAEASDNVGLLCGRWGADVTRVMVTLDITLEVIEEAKRWGAQMLVAHHPLFWNLTSITDDSAAGKKLLSLCENRMAALCMHTNLDAVQGGLNSILAEKMCIPTPHTIVDKRGTDENGNSYGFGIWGILEHPASVTGFAEHAKQVLGCANVRYYDAGKPVKKVAVGSGSCCMIFEQVVALGCDTFLTGDIKHNYWLDARDYGVNLIDGGHFPTEFIICDWLVDKLSIQFPQVEFLVAKRSIEPFTVL